MKNQIGRQMLVKVAVLWRACRYGFVFGGEAEVIRLFEKQIGRFEQVFFIGRQRLFCFGFFGQFFHEVTFSVTSHLNIVFIFAQFFCDVVVIANIFKYRQERLEQHGHAKDENEFFHAVNLSNKKISSDVNLELKNI